jgi:hypothetical protein
LAGTYETANDHGFINDSQLVDTLRQHKLLDPALTDFNGDPIDTPEVIAAELHAGRESSKWGLSYTVGCALVNDRKAERESGNFTRPGHVSDFDARRWQAGNRLNSQSPAGCARSKLEDAEERLADAKAEQAEAKKALAEARGEVEGKNAPKEITGKETMKEYIAKRQAQNDVNTITPFAPELTTVDQLLKSTNEKFSTNS